jgi:glycosyltransferase involved in cell wall biosynthesis
MPRVLIPSDDAADPGGDPGIIEGYRSLGWEVVTGAANFNIRSCRYDLVHYQWPEEYCGWTRPPTEQQLKQIEQNVRWWASQGPCIITVHNLFAHYGASHPAFHELYSCFYRHCSVISHFSHASQELVLSEFPAARHARHVVHCPAGYEVTVAKQRHRGSRRAEMGINDNEFVILMVGRLRAWREVVLMQQAFDKARVPNKRLLMAGKFHLTGSPWRNHLLLFRLNWWLKRRRAVVDMRYIPVEDISRWVDSSDVAIVPRFGGLNSGVVFLAMSLGRMVIAPNCGAYPEQLAGTRNLLFRPGDAADLAAKLEEAANLDTDDIGRENAAIASKWSWAEICRVCLEAVRQQTNVLQEESRTA